MQNLIDIIEDVANEHLLNFNFVQFNKLSCLFLKAVKADLSKHFTDLMVHLHYSNETNEMSLEVRSAELVYSKNIGPRKESSDEYKSLIEFSDAVPGFPSEQFLIDNNISIVNDVIVNINDVPVPLQTRQPVDGKTPLTESLVNFSHILSINISRYINPVTFETGINYKIRGILK